MLYRFIQLLLIFLSVKSELISLFEEIPYPAQVNWPKTWISNNIDLSTNHAGESATLTLYFSTTINIPSNTYAEITILKFPETFSTILSETFAGKTIIAEFNIGKLPSPGSYGPLSLIISLVKGGSIIALSQSFGTFAIVDSLPQEEELNVSWAKGASLEVSELTSLQFSFEITKKIEKYDYFVIKISDDFKFDERLISFTWIDGLIYLNEHFLSYNQGANSIIIYGLINPVYSKTLITFIMLGLFNPRVNDISSPFFITFHRFGTATTIETFSGSLSASDLMLGAITLRSWKTSNDYIIKTQIVSGLVIFMTLKFELNHNLIAGDYIEIFYSTNVNLHAYTYPDNKMQGLTAATSTTGVLISDNKELDCRFDEGFYYLVICTANDDFNDLVSVTTLIQFSGSEAYISSIKSYDYYGKQIDSIGKSGLFSYADSSSVVLIDEEVWAYPVYNALNYPLEGINFASENTGLHFTLSFKVMQTLTTEQTIKIYFPLKNSEIALINYIAIPKTIYGKYCYSTSSLLDWLCYPISSDLLSLIFVNELINFEIEENLYQNNYGHFYFGSQDESLVDNHIFTPIFPSQSNSKEEFVLKYKVDSIEYIFSKPIFFHPNNPFYYDLRVFCTDVRLDGLPIQIYIQFSFDYKISNSLYLDIEFTNVQIDNDLGSGLESGSEYPSDKENNPILIYNESGNPHLVFEFNSEISKYYDFTLAVPFPAVPSYEKLSSIYTLKTTYDNLEYILWKANVESDSPITESVGTERNYDLPSINAQSVISDLSFYAVASNYICLPLAIVTSSHLFINDALIKIDDMNIDNLIFFTSKDFAFTYSSAYSPSYCLTPSSNIHISSVHAPWFSKNSKINVLYGGYNLNDICDNYNYYTISTNYLSFDSFTYTPKFDTGYSFVHQTIHLTFSLRFTGTIHEGSIINIYLDTSGFSFSQASYKIYVESNSGSGFINDSKISFNIVQSTSDNTIFIDINSVIPPSITDYDVQYQHNIYKAFNYVDVTFNDNICYRWNTYDDPDNFASTVFSASNIYSAVSDASFNIFPLIQGAVDVYFETYFESPYILPAETYITISGEYFNDDPNIISNTWFHQGFYDVSIIQGNLVIKTLSPIQAMTKIHIIKDLAFSIAKTQTETHPFKIQVEYNGFLFIDDTNVLHQILPVSKSINIDITSIIATVSISNYGNKSWHKFTIIIPTEITEDSIIIFDVPKEYDAIPENIIIFNSLPLVNFINAKSSHGEILCYAYHWIIICSNINVLSKEPFSIDLFIKNPSVSSVFWNVYIFNDKFWIANPYYDVKIKFTDIPEKNIDLYYANRTDTDIDIISDIVLSAYINDIFEVNSIIYVEFPKPYDLGSLNRDIINCYVLTYDSYGNEKIVSSNTNCYVSNNVVEFIIDKKIDISGEVLTHFVLNGINNPLEGLSRLDFFIEEYMQYNYWAEKFTLYAVNTNTYDKVSVTVTSQSFKNLNAAYTGFNKISIERLVVNKGNNIELVLGTYSSWISVGSDSIKSSIISISASNFIINGPLYFSNDGTYTITNSNPTTFFKIGCSLDTSKGVYYISWIKNYENGFWGETNFYKSPELTIVEVIMRSFNILNGKALKISPTGLSFPIELRIDNGISPFSELEIIFKMEDDSSKIISFSPTVFKPGENKIYFTINCQNCNNGDSFYINPSISEIYTNIFTIKNKILLNFEPQYENAAIASAYLEVLSQTEITVKFSSNNWAIATWALMTDLVYNYVEKSREIDYIKQRVKQIVGDNENLTLEEQELAYKNHPYYIDIADWEEFSLYIFYERSFAYFTCQNLIKNSTNQVIHTFSSLIAETTYHLVAYFDNLSGQSPVFNETSATTLSLNNPIIMIIDYINDTHIDNEKINSVFANLLHIVGNRLKTKKIITTRRILAKSSETIILPDITSNINLYDLVNFYSGYYIDAFAKEGLLIKEISYSEFIYDQTYFFNYSWSINTNNITFEFEIATNGLVCCEYEYDVDINYYLSSQFIFFGLDRYANDNSENTICLSVVTGKNQWFEFQFNDYSASDLVWEKITWTCAAYNDKPILPECFEGNLLNYTYNRHASFQYKLVLAFGIMFAI
ncbi:hypothetical protein SteCoe_29974 [Stentor coeruleus]|uniref:PKD/REJ-like domain-containing protein n=1 Tax=Stentor coeruleus TaxID=5963 RepID=A0A1R2B526_9CILI|nr:hypothetical protein SteCoe_29974 [Stentor coeruleus]